MEEAQPVEDHPRTEAPNPNPDPPPETAPARPTEPRPPPTAAEAPLPPPPPPLPSSETEKTPLDGDGHVQDCSYFKMRAVVKDIRPHMVEVLRTVDFRICKGADELREKMKLIMELYRQMTAETDTITKCKTTTEGHSAACENGAGPEVQDQLPDVMPANQPQLETTLRKPSDNKPFRSILPPERPERQQTDDSVNQGCIVGGSAFGWNFITFPGNDPIYYGRTKESFRTANVTS